MTDAETSLQQKKMYYVAKVNANKKKVYELLREIPPIEKLKAEKCFGLIKKDVIVVDYSSGSSSD